MPNWLKWGMIVGISIGLLARLFRLIVNLQLWGDEAYLAANLIYRDYSELWGPLENRQVAPGLYNTITKACWELLEIPFAFKIPPIVFGVLALGLMTWGAFKFMKRAEAWWAVLLFAVSAPLLCYSVEVKPYSMDLCTSLILIGISYAFIQSLNPPSTVIETPRPSRKHFIFGVVFLLAPALSIWVSFPMVLMSSAMGLTMLIMLIKRKAPVKAWVLWAMAGILFLISLGLLYFFQVKALQAHPTSEFMKNYWNNNGAFMPLTEPWKIPLWLLKAHTGHGFGYPLGDKNFASTFTTLLMLGGLWTLFTQKRRKDLLFLVMPFLVAMLLSGFYLYPYGISSRVFLYMAPLICIIAATGINGVVETLKGPLRSIWCIAMLALMMGVPLGQAGWLVHRRYEQHTQRNYEGQLTDLLRNHTDTPIHIMNPFTPFEGNGTNVYFDLTTETRLGDKASWDNSSEALIKTYSASDAPIRFSTIARYPSDPTKPAHLQTLAWYQALDARFTSEHNKEFIYMSDTQRIKVVIYRRDSAEAEK